MIRMGDPLGCWFEGGGLLWRGEYTTVMAALVALTPPTEAVMVAVPPLTAVIKPAALTVTILVLLLV